MDVILGGVTGRSAVIEIQDGGKYFTKRVYGIFVDEVWYGETDRTVTGIYGLEPDREVKVSVFGDGRKMGEVCFRTERETVTLNVRDFGAAGDGMQEDTKFIQAAVMACPFGGRVLVPEGVRKVGSLFLKSHIRLEIGQRAVLSGVTEPCKFPVMPGNVPYGDGKGEYFLGTWEGEPQPMYAGILCGIGVEDAVVYGQGIVDGNASFENWWKEEAVRREIKRPRLVFLNQCSGVWIHGLTFCNSPSWTIHPYFCRDMKFLGIQIENPKISPNTDGLNPESCVRTEIIGVRFSLGDDCIALKSGKIDMGSRYKAPCRDIIIRQCLMENGHGAVTLGSEMAAGVVNLSVEECVFRHTDRGLRIKTRRGRGKDSVLNNISFRNLIMDHVLTPIVVNAFYFCDKDGHTDYVQSREALPVDERTPSLGKMTFENIRCSNCHVAAAYIEGLPESKIQEIVMRNIEFTYAENAVSDLPAMADGVVKCSKRGIFARNITKLILDNVNITGQEGQPYECIQVEEIRC